ncbi:hypothetical protein CLAIMM_08542 [Cladophialophora immunda]|nr:hypothetical protein CLAIMM_08542 [Cladophialophora immunda]
MVEPERIGAVCKKCYFSSTKAKDPSLAHCALPAAQGSSRLPPIPCGTQGNIHSSMALPDITGRGKSLDDAVVIKLRFTSSPALIRLQKIKARGEQPVGHNPRALKTNRFLHRAGYSNPVSAALCRSRVDKSPNNFFRSRFGFDWTASMK